MKKYLIVFLIISAASLNIYGNFSSGAAKFNNGNYWGAVGDLNKVIKNNPKHIQALSYLSSALYSLGKYSKILQIFPNAIKYGNIDLNNTTYKKENANILKNIGKACYYTGNSKKSIVAFNLCNKILSNDDLVFNFLGLAYLKTGAYRSAEISFMTAININKKNNIYHNNLGAVYLELKQFKDALRCFEQSVRINWNYYNGWDNIWVSREKLGWTTHRGWKDFSYFITLTRDEKQKSDRKQMDKIKEQERLKRERERENKRKKEQEQKRLESEKKRQEEKRRNLEAEKKRLEKQRIEEQRIEEQRLREKRLKEEREKELKKRQLEKKTNNTTGTNTN